MHLRTGLAATLLCLAIAGSAANPGLDVRLNEMTSSTQNDSLVRPMSLMPAAAARIPATIEKKTNWRFLGSAITPAIGGHRTSPHPANRFQREGRYLNWHWLSG